MITEMVTHIQGKRPRQVPPMPPRTGPKPPGYLYIREWIDAAGLSVEIVAKRMGVNRVTVHRYEKQQHRLNPGKVASLARAIGIEPGQFNYPPDRPSVDALLKGASADTYKTAFDVVKRITRLPTKED